MSDIGGSEQVVYLLGKLEGQVRELVHTVGNLSQTVTALTEKVNAAAGLPDRVKANSEAIDDLRARVGTLEASENKRIGAMSLGGWVLKALPYIVSTGIGAGIMEIIR